MFSSSVVPEVGAFSSPKEWDPPDLAGYLASHPQLEEAHVAMFCNVFVAPGGEVWQWPKCRQWM